LIPSVPFKYFYPGAKVLKRDYAFNTSCQPFVLDIKGNRIDFREGYLGAQRAKPLPTPRQPPGNPQASPSKVTLYYGVMTLPHSGNRDILQIT